MLRVDRNVRFVEDSLWLHVDRIAGPLPQAWTLLHFEQSAEIQAKYLNLLHADRSAGFRRVSLTLHVDSYARFRGERSEGIFSKKIFRFYCWNGTKKTRYEGSWTKEQYRSLLAEQQKDPIPLTTESKSGKTWWMYQGRFYWEDFSAREVENEGRVGPDVLKEIKAIFYRGHRDRNGISGNLHRFQCLPDEQERPQSKVFTKKQCQTLLAKQQETPVKVLNNSKSGRTWWMYQDKTYWEESSLGDDVSLLFLEGVENLDGIAVETTYHFRHKRRGWEETYSDQFWTEKQYRSLLARQRKNPVRLRMDNSVIWWMYQDRIYWSESILMDVEARMLVANWDPGPDGSFTKTRYRFFCGVDTSENKQEGLWTEEQYQSLLAEQQVDPVRMRSDRESGKTWWMFQDKFYWEDYSSDWSKKLADQEVKAHFLEGHWETNAISIKIYRSQRKQGGQVYKSIGHWTENGYQTLLLEQQKDPVQVLWNEESGRKWWMFRDKFYWEDDDLKKIEVKALLLDRIRKKERQIERAMRSMEQESRLPTVKELIPDYVKHQVWRRDGGLCARCRVHCGREEISVYVHIVPVSQGGNNTMDNIQLLCDMCDFPF